MPASFGPTWLSQADADEMRAEQLTLLQEIGSVGQIKRPTYVPNGYGGTTVVFNTTYDNVPMRLWISSGPNGTSQESRFWGEQEQASTDAFLVVAFDQDIQEQDWVHVEGRDYKVVGLQITDSFRTATRARLQSLRNVTGTS